MIDPNVITLIIIVCGMLLVLLMPSKPSLASIQQIRVLRLQPGDIIILKSTKTLSVTQAEHIKASARDLLKLAGHGHVSVSVLDEGIDVEVLRKQVITVGDRIPWEMPQ